MKPSEWVAELKDPDNVGQSEYRILYELLSDIVLSDETDDDQTFALMRSSLDEVIGIAKFLKRDMPRRKRERKKRTKHTVPAAAGVVGSQPVEGDVSPLADQSAVA